MTGPDLARPPTDHPQNENRIVGKRRTGPTSQSGEHLGITAVTLTFGTGDGVKLAGIGHQHGGTEAGEITADPRAMRARFQRDGGAGKIREELRQGRPGVG